MVSVLKAVFQNMTIYYLQKRNSTKHLGQKSLQCFPKLSALFKVDKLSKETESITKSNEKNCELQKIQETNEHSKSNNRYKQYRKTEEEKNLREIKMQANDNELNDNNI